MVNVNRLILLVFGFFCVCCASCKDAVSSIVDDSNEENESSIDTMVYRALVYVDKHSLNERYGGETKFKADLKIMFENTTKFWNNSKNKFKYYFRFVPAGLRVYDYVEGESYQDAADEAMSVLDSQYDYVVFFCLSSYGSKTSCGGSSGGHSVVWYTRTLENQEKDGDIFHDGAYPTKLGTYSNLGHEYGHFRGATDLYQYPIKAYNNPINGEKFHPGPCNMGTGEWVWSDYCSAVFNYTAKYKRLPSDWGERRFPKSIEISVVKNGKPVKDAIVKLFGCRLGGGDKNLPSGDNGPDVYSEPFRVLITNADGKVKIDSAYRLYQVKTDGTEKLPKPLPWNYWNNFLVEASTAGGDKAYIWMPDLEVHRQHLDEGTEVFKTVVEL